MAKWIRVILTVLAAVRFQTQSDSSIGIPMQRQHTQELSEHRLLELVGHYAVCVRVPKEYL